MPAHTRTKAQIQSDRIAITKLYLEGKYQQEIATILGVSQEQISYDLRAVQTQWRDIPQAELNELKAKELAKIDHLERSYWQAWEKSCQAKKTTSTGKDGEIIKLKSQSEERSGNPAYLKGVMDCINKRCDILGLNAPVKAQLSGTVELSHRVEQYKDMDEFELEREFQSRLKQS